MKTLQQQLDPSYTDRLISIWHSYEPSFRQPRRSSANIDLRESIGLNTVRPGELVTSLEGEMWRIARHVEYGQEILLPWIHVSNYGRVISHVYPSATQKKLGKKWDYSYERLCDGKLKRYSNRTKTEDETTSGWKLLIKVPHYGRLMPVWQDKECTKQSAASERQERDIPVHILVANTWCPIYEDIPDVPEGMLKALRWDTMTKEDKLWCVGLFEVDHKDQDSLNNYSTNLRRTTGQENNRAALIARGGNHANHRITEDQDETEVETTDLMEFFT